MAHSGTTRLAACFCAHFTQEQASLTLAHGKDFTVYKTYRQVLANTAQEDKGTPES